jgi:hypothetical protein
MVPEYRFLFDFCVCFFKDVLLRTPFHDAFKKQTAPIEDWPPESQAGKIKIFHRGTLPNKKLPCVIRLQIVRTVS